MLLQTPVMMFNLILTSQFCLTSLFLRNTQYHSVLSVVEFFCSYTVPSVYQLGRDWLQLTGIQNIVWFGPAQCSPTTLSLSLYYTDYDYWDNQKLSDQIKDDETNVQCFMFSKYSKSNTYNICLLLVVNHHQCTALLSNIDVMTYCVLIKLIFPYWINY